MTTGIVAAILAVTQIPNTDSTDRYALPKAAPPAVIQEKPAAEQKSGFEEKPATPASEAIEEQPKSAFPPQKSNDSVPSDPADSITPAPPANVGSQLIPVRPSSSLAADLLNRALQLPEDQTLSGRSVGLVELLAAKEGIGSRHVELVEAYWTLTKDVAQYHFSLMEYERLTQVDRSLQASQLAMSSAQAEAAALVQQDKLAVVQAQHVLAELMNLPSDGSLPLPADRPLVGGYRTYYEAIFGSGMASPIAQRNARRLHDTLPIMHQALRARAAAVQAADDLVIATLIAVERGEADHGTLLARHAKLREQRGEFLSNVLNYNQAIAQYAVIAARPGAQPADLLPMLIKVPVMTSAPEKKERAPQATFQTPNEVQPATHLEAEPDSAVRPAESSQTFAAPSADQASSVEQSESSQTAQPPRLFIPPSGARQMRSVVVPPRNRP